MPNLNFPPARLFAEGERLPAIKSWLLDTVWADDRYRQTEPEHCLRTGEEAVCRLEELIATGAQQVWDELHAESLRSPTVKGWLGPDECCPGWHPDLQILPGERLALLRGRLRARPAGASSRTLYQHGGFSLMEVLVPWIELEPR